MTEERTYAEKQRDVSLFVGGLGVGIVGVLVFVVFMSSLVPSTEIYVIKSASVGSAGTLEVHTTDGHLFTTETNILKSLMNPGDVMKISHKGQWITNIERLDVGKEMKR